MNWLRSAGVLGQRYNYSTIILVRSKIGRDTWRWGNEIVPTLSDALALVEVFEERYIEWCCCVEENIIDVVFPATLSVGDNEFMHCLLV